MCGHVVPRMSQTEGDTRGQEVKTSSAQCVSCCRGYCGTLEHRWKTNQCYNPAINDQINYAHMFLFFQEQQTKIQNTLYLQNHREVFFILCSVKKRGVKKHIFPFRCCFSNVAKKGSDVLECCRLIRAVMTSFVTSKPLKCPATF